MRLLESGSLPAIAITTSQAADRAFNHHLRIRTPQRVMTMLRSMIFNALVLTLFMAVGGVRVSNAAPVRTAHVEAELVAEQSALIPGRPNTVALRLVMERGWHTYWQNAGDSGLPTTLAWKLPEGLKAGPIQWPAPRALPVGPLVNYGYEGEVLLLSDIATVPDFLSGKTVTLSARADWLALKENCK